MKVNGIALAAFVGASLFSTATLASGKADFEAMCPATTAENHPNIEDVDAACSCVVENADEETLAELAHAKGPDELGAASLEALRSCGYKV